MIKEDYAPKSLSAIRSDGIPAAVMSKRMDGARSATIVASGAFETPLDLTPQSILDIVNAYIGYDANEEAAYDRAIQERMKPKFFDPASPLCIVEARDSGLKPRVVREAIGALSDNELSRDVGMVRPNAYVNKNYFTNTLPERVRRFDAYAKNILLAVAGGKVVGFLISKIQTDGLLRGESSSYYVHYLAVDSSCKRGGVGTQLMLTAMNKAQTLGKRLELGYIDNGPGFKTKHAFYQSFTTRFAMPYDCEERLINRTPSYFPSWNLDGVKGLSKKA